MENFLKTLFPEECIFCQKEGTSFCTKCLSSCELLQYGYCVICKEKAFEGKTHKFCISDTVPTQIFSPLIYKDKVRECIMRSKYASMEFASLKALTHYGVTYFKQTSPILDDFIIIAVPISWQRYKARGFNQVDLIAAILGKRLGLRFENPILIRKRETEAQSGQSKDQRQRNVSDAFEVSPKKDIRGQKFLLVDDICTTGSTLLECSRVLYGAGALEVRCFTLTRVL
ncbi:ComF family protein [candidate division WWE3 bacterium]|nr:ComF family protein [candidate division WWE3 bacterium]